MYVYIYIYIYIYVRGEKWNCMNFVRFSLYCKTLMLICGVFVTLLHAFFAGFCTYIIGIIRGLIHILAGYLDSASEMDLSQRQTMTWWSSSPNDGKLGGEDEEWESRTVRETEEESEENHVNRRIVRETEEDSEENHVNRTKNLRNHVQRKRSLTGEEVKEMADAFLSRVKARFRSSEAKKMTMMMGSVSEREINQINNTINTNDTVNANDDANDDEFHNLLKRQSSHLVYQERLHRSYGPYHN